MQGNRREIIGSSYFNFKDASWRDPHTKSRNISILFLLQIMLEQVTAGHPASQVL